MSEQQWNLGQLRIQLGPGRGHKQTKAANLPSFFQTHLVKQTITFLMKEATELLKGDDFPQKIVASLLCNVAKSLLTPLPNSIVQPVFTQRFSL
jgi:hypothetical protein